jgi:hypothetical protein
METIALTSTTREPWNKGKLVGQKAPFKLKEIWAIRVRLQIARRYRDLALFNLASAASGPFTRRTPQRINPVNRRTALCKVYFPSLETSCVGLPLSEGSVSQLIPDTPLSVRDGESLL